MKEIVKTDNCVDDIKSIIEQGRQTAYASVNLVMINTYWNIGRRIVEEEQNGAERAEYGKQLLSQIAIELKEYGDNFSERNLRHYRQFYMYFKELEIWYTCVPNLKWSHFRTLLRVSDEDARIWYMKEANEQMWSVRTLDRNISTQYYYRLLQSPKKEAVMEEMKKKTADFQQNKFELLKSPIVAEFLGYKTEEAYTEKDLETSILSHIRDFLMEMGKGFAFVARQQHIVTDTEDYYIDLVFYNIELRCYVLVDLKMGKVTHQDVGQMDMYVRMYDDLKRKADENPTIGVLLCAETSEDIARYSVLNDNKQLYMAKYLTYLPTEEQLRIEIERQKEIFYLQHPELKPTNHEQD
ncbi:MAG: PDDEXK nuclease domain-containing protein [Paludibacteraceae bacterium]|nr:PDDEXK nuclease domain-containing protein [Paludibacteraceae bacterium]